MNIEEAISELEETWDYTIEELNHIREVMEMVAKTKYAYGHQDGYDDCYNGELRTYKDGVKIDE